MKKISSILLLGFVLAASYAESAVSDKHQDDPLKALLATGDTLALRRACLLVKEKIDIQCDQWKQVVTDLTRSYNESIIKLERSTEDALLQLKVEWTKSLEARALLDEGVKGCRKPTAEDLKIRYEIESVNEKAKRTAQALAQQLDAAIAAKKSEFQKAIFVLLGTKDSIHARLKFLEDEKRLQKCEEASLLAGVTTTSPALTGSSDLILQQLAQTTQILEQLVSRMGSAPAQGGGGHHAPFPYPVEARRCGGAERGFASMMMAAPMRRPELLAEASFDPRFQGISRGWGMCP